MKTNYTPLIFASLLLLAMIAVYVKNEFSKQSKKRIKK